MHLSQTDEKIETILKKKKKNQNISKLTKRLGRFDFLQQKEYQFVFTANRYAILFTQRSTVQCAKFKAYRNAEHFDSFAIYE